MVLKSQLRSICQVSSLDWALDPWTSGQEIKPHWKKLFLLENAFDANIDNIGNFMLIAQKSIGAQ